MYRGGGRQQEKYGPSSRLKVRVTLEDIYNGKQIPVSFRERITDLIRLPTQEWSCVLIAEAVVLMIQMMCTSANVATVTGRSLRLDNLDLASFSNSKELAPIAMVREEESNPSAMCAREIELLEAWTSLVSSLRKESLMVMNINSKRQLMNS